MAEEWRREMYAQAKEAVESFVAGATGFTVDSEEPETFEARIDRGTNFVLFGQLGAEPVIYKWYAPGWGTPRFRSERTALQHFSPTGYVPKIHAEIPDQLIVMDRLPGQFLDREVDNGELDEEGLDALGREFGHVVGLMVDTPIPVVEADDSLLLGSGHIPWSLDLVEAIRLTTDVCRRDHDLFEASGDPFYGETLSLVESQLDRIPGQRQVFLHEDLHCFAHRGRISGVFDLEFCRLGTELMQMERTFRFCAPAGMTWESTLAGYQKTTGRNVRSGDYIFMLAMAMFYYHIRITRWGKPNTEEDWVANYLSDMRADAQRYADYLDLRAALPSL